MKLVPFIGLSVGFLIVPLLYTKTSHYYFKRYPINFEEQKLNYVYSPNQEKYRKNIIIGPWTIFYPGVGNGADGKIREIISATASLSNVLNFLLDSYLNDEERFYDFGSTGGTLAHYLSNLLLALNQKNLKSIIFDPLSLRNDLYNPHRGSTGVLEAVNVFEQFLNKLPEHKIVLKEVLNYFYELDDYKNSVDIYGIRWRQHVSQDYLNFKSPNSLDSTRNMIFNFFRPALSMREYVLFSLSNYQEINQQEWKRVIEDNLNYIASHYMNANMNAPVQKFNGKWLSSQFEGKEGSIRLKMLAVMSQIVRRQGVSFACYLPPIVEMEQSFYQMVFLPKVVQPIEELARMEGFTVINRTMDHDLNQYDLIARGEPAVKFDGVTNIVGKFKTARLIIKDLKQLGLVKVFRERSDAEVWAGWSKIPTVTKPIPFVEL